MSPGSEVALVVGRELRKNVRSAKGIVLLGLSLLGGVMVALIFAFISAKEHEFIAKQLADAPPDVAADLTDKFHHQLILQLGGGDDALGDLLSKIPVALLGAFHVSVWVAPLLVALLGFDAVSGELQHRTVRYWTVRTRRVSFYVGKVLGLWAVVSLLTLLVHVFIWCVVIARGETAGAVIEWGPRLWLVTLPMSLVWCAVAQLVGSLFRTPILSLLVTGGSFFVFWIAYIAGASGKVPPLAYAYPNTYDSWLLHPHPDRVFEGLAICLGSAALYMAAGAAIFARRDV
jgi:ABC-type transport system involved in multi-copper enzyme maturation permease subunit